MGAQAQSPLLGWRPQRSREAEQRERVAVLIVRCGCLVRHSRERAHGAGTPALGCPQAGVLEGDALPGDEAGGWGWGGLLEGGAGEEAGGWGEGFEVGRGVRVGEGALKGGGGEGGGLG